MMCMILATSAANVTHVPDLGTVFLGLTVYTGWRRTGLENAALKRGYLVMLRIGLYLAGIMVGILVVALGSAML